MSGDLSADRVAHLVRFAIGEFLGQRRQYLIGTSSSFPRNDTDDGIITPTPLAAPFADFGATDFLALDFFAFDLVAISATPRVGTAATIAAVPHLKPLVAYLYQAIIA
jgi:hypothetical protein